MRSVPDNGMVVQRSNCTLPIARQLTLTGRILDKFTEDQNALSNLKLWSLGGLKGFPEVQERLAILAKRSPGWDAAKGKPKSGAAEAFLIDLAVREGLFRAWEDLFEKHGLRIRLIAADEVVVETAGQLAFFPKLRRAGVRSIDVLPVSFLTEFRVSKQGE
jgi:hypothetical protein